MAAPGTPSPGLTWNNTHLQEGLDCVQQYQPPPPLLPIVTHTHHGEGLDCIQQHQRARVGGVDQLPSAMQGAHSLQGRVRVYGATSAARPPLILYNCTDSRSLPPPLTSVTMWLVLPPSSLDTSSSTCSRNKMFPNLNLGQIECALHVKTS